MIWTVYITNKEDGRQYKERALAENREDAIMVAMRLLSKKVETPYHFVANKAVLL